MCPNRRITHLKRPNLLDAGGFPGAGATRHCYLPWRAHRAPNDFMMLADHDLIGISKKCDLMSSDIKSVYQASGIERQIS